MLVTLKDNDSTDPFWKEIYNLTDIVKDVAGLRSYAWLISINQDSSYQTNFIKNLGDKIYFPGYLKGDYLSDTGAIAVACLENTSVCFMSFDDSTIAQFDIFKIHR